MLVWTCLEGLTMIGGDYFTSPKMKNNIDGAGTMYSYSLHKLVCIDEWLCRASTFGGVLLREGRAPLLKNRGKREGKDGARVFGHVDREQEEEEVRAPISTR